MPSPLVETQRLILRPYEVGDMESFVALNSDPEVRRHVGGALAQADAVSRFERFMDATQDDAWAIILRSLKLYIGHCWLVMREDPEIGFLLHRSFWCQGYGTEVAEAVLDYALTQKGYARVVATVDAEHRASIGVLEKAGMRREGERRDEQGAYFVYSATRT